MIIILIFLLALNCFAGDDDLSYNFTASCVSRGVSTTNTSFDMVTGGLITMSNNPAWDGDTYTFDGATHLGCYNNQTTGNFQTDSYFTVYAIFKTTNAAAFKGIFGKYHLSPDQGWFVGTFKSGTNVFFYAQVQSVSTNYLAKYGNVNINDNQLHVGTMVYNGQAVTNQFFIYVDGVRQAETVDKAGVVTAITSMAPIVFGSRETGTSSERMSGQFKHFEVIQEAHNAYQVSKHTTELQLKYIKLP